MSKGSTALQSVFGGVLEPKEHKIIDYVIAGTFAVGALALNFDGIAYFLAFALAVGHGAMAILTNFNGRGKMVSLRLHGASELLLAPMLALLTFFDQFSQPREAMFFAGMSGLLFIAWLVSNYNRDDEVAF